MALAPGCPTFSYGHGGRELFCFPLDGPKLLSSEFQRTPPIGLWAWPMS